MKNTFHLLAPKSTFGVLAPKNTFWVFVSKSTYRVFVPKLARVEGTLMVNGPVKLKGLTELLNRTVE